MSRSFTIFESGRSLIGMVIRKYVLKYFVNKTLFVVSYQAILVLGAIRKQTAAKSALDLPRVMISIAYVDFKHHIKQYILSTWQDDWDGVVTNKLHSLKPILGDWQSSYRRYTFDPFVHLEKGSSTSV